MSVTLVADSSGTIPGFDAEQARDCAFMHDPTVRGWIAEQRAVGVALADPVRIVVAEDWWVNPGGIGSLTFPVDPRDMAAVEDIRRELALPPHREVRSDG